MSDFTKSRFLSEPQRKQIEKLNIPEYNKRVITGDRAHANGDYGKEAEDHRWILEKMKKHQKIELKDPASQDAWNKDCVLIHESDHVEKGKALGLTFDQMFTQKQNGTYEMSFKYIPRPSYLKSSPPPSCSSYSNISVNTDFGSNSLYQASQNMSLDEILYHLQ